MRRVLAGIVPLLLPIALPAQTTPTDLVLTSLDVVGVTQPIAVEEPNDGSGRLFIVSRTGTIHIYRNGAVVSPPFLTIPVSTAGEQGLFALAFHPDFATNGRLFVQHTRAGGGTNIGSFPDQLTVEYRVTGANPDVADPTTRTEILRIGDLADNHNGGDLQFGPDGYLYIAMGDGGPQQDPHGFAQCQWRKPPDNNPASCQPGAGTEYALLGKILRIDVDGTTLNAPEEMCGTATGGTANYRIPADNPNVGSLQTCDEIWHRGLRNPFRFTFDRETGEMIIGDVGQNTWEEVSLLPAGAGGQDLGWRTCEGRQLRGDSVNLGSCPVGTLPILDYLHAGGRCSITGGYRYRGPIPAFRGTIVYADLCTREIFFGRPDAGSTSGWSAARWESTPGTPVLAAGSPFGFGEDLAGNVYLSTGSGGVYRFDSASGADTLFENGFE